MAYSAAYAGKIDRFHKGRHSVGAAAVYHTPVDIFGGDSSISLAGIEATYGRMLTEPKSRLGVKGNLELLIRGHALKSVNGPDGSVLGLGLGLRYNMIPDSSKWTFYAGLGGGIDQNSIYRKDREQKAFGQKYVFNLFGSLGARYHISDKISLELAAGGSHWSWGSAFMKNWSDDGGVPGRNHGQNSLFGTFGLTKEF